jgi:LacI family transcriptional regulator
MLRNQRATIKDVARDVGVSPQTVSRVLNKRPDVAAETRQRIEAAIRRLNYHPSTIARSLFQKQSHTLGLVIPNLQSMPPYYTLRGIASQAEKDGYRLLLEELIGSDTDVRAVLNNLQARQVDGILWNVPEIGNNREWLSDVLPELHVPILFTFMPPKPNVPVVTIDNVQGAQLALHHLIEQGCRKIGHISGPLEWWEAQARLRTWRETLLGAGLLAEDRQWVEGNWGADGGAQAMSQLLAQFPEIDGLFAGNDAMALGALYVAHQQGIRVPQDVAVVGFDNFTAGAAYLWPPLTTVQQDQTELGITAVRELVNLIDAHRQGVMAPMPAIQLPTKLIVRESSRKR